MGAEKKLKQYIKDDRPKKLKSYIESHDVDAVSVMLGQGRGLLHYCAQYGSSEMLRCLLKLDCAPDEQDRSGNLPLHLAALRALEEDGPDAKETLEGQVIPLLKAYPLGQDVENRRGITGHDLVTAVKDKVNTATLSAEQANLRQERIHREEEELWRRKLNEEAMFEFEEQAPRYGSEEDYAHEEQKESYDEWVERIRQQMSAKRGNQSHVFTRDKKGKMDRGARDKRKKRYDGNSMTEEEEAQERLNRAREEMKRRYKPPPVKQDSEKLMEKKKRYERKFAHLLNHLSGRMLTYGCIPWPHLNLDSIVATLFCDLSDKSSPEYRKYLRSQQVRWHPDKFMQKLGEHLHLDHVQKIMSRVKAISQILNKLSSE